MESDCFSFTESYRSSEEFQIHVFSCHIKEAVSSIQILLIKYCTSTWYIIDDLYESELYRLTKCLFIDQMKDSVALKAD